MGALLRKSNHSPRLRDLHRAGWVKYNCLARSVEGLAAELTELSETLGPIARGRAGQKIESLSPVYADDAHARSLSSRYGVSRFPLHVNGAHQVAPPRYLALACVNEGKYPTPTLLADFDRKEIPSRLLAAAHSSVFRVRNGRRSFFASVLDRSRPFVRFDPGCMIPVNAAGEDTFAALSDILGAKAISIDWSVGDVLVFDNWRLLHGRGGEGAVASTDRQLLRATFA